MYKLGSKYKVVMLARTSVDTLSPLEEYTRNLLEGLGCYLEVISPSDLWTYDYSDVGMLVINGDGSINSPSISTVTGLNQLSVNILSLCIGTSITQLGIDVIQVVSDNTALDYFSPTEPGKLVYGDVGNLLATSSVIRQRTFLVSAITAAITVLSSDASNRVVSCYREYNGYKRIHWAMWDTRVLNLDGCDLLRSLVFWVCGWTKYNLHAEWTSPALLTDYVKEVIDSKIGWFERTVNGTSVKVYTAFSDDPTIPDSSNFKRVYNLGSVAGIMIGQNLTGKYMFIRAIMVTTNELESPVLSDFKCMIENFRSNSIVTVSVADHTLLNHNITDRLVVKYDSNKGNLRGRGGVIGSFDMDVELDSSLFTELVVPAVTERLTASVQDVLMEFTKILYSSIDNTRAHVVKCTAISDILMEFTMVTPIEI